MESQTLPMAHFRLLAESLAIGLLIGVERYKARRPGERGFGSVRTFAVIGLVGGVCGLLHTTAFTATAFGALAVLVTVAFSKEWETNSGLTTEVAALTVFWLAYLVRVNETLAVSAAIVLAILLASKHALHGFLADSVSERELFDTLKFLAVVFVVYPLLPDRSLGPWGFFNPARVWLMIVLVSSVSYAGYLLVRWLGPNRGVLLSGLAGGLVSTTATTLALAGRTKKAPKSSEFLGLTGGLANSVQLPKILVLISVVNYNLGVELAPLLIAGAAAGLVALGAIAGLAARGRDASPAAAVAYRNPFSLTPALRFGAIFVVVLFAVRAAEVAFGGRGILLASALGGAVSATATSLSVANLANQGSLPMATAAVSVLLALTTNALIKQVLALVQGTGAYAWRLGLGFAMILGVTWATFWVLA
jgi:uncharacterized membrane protein (DUF4010 family)